MENTNTETNKDTTSTKTKEIGALWLREAVAECDEELTNKYLGGELVIDNQPKMRIMVIKNQNKTKDNHPDYRIILQSIASDNAKVNELI